MCLFAEPAGCESYKRIPAAAEHSEPGLERPTGLPRLQRDLLPPLPAQIPQVYPQGTYPTHMLKKAVLWIRIRCLVMKWLRRSGSVNFELRV
jgi:hypothetical protein